MSSMGMAVHHMQCQQQPSVWFSFFYPNLVAASCVEVSIIQQPLVEAIGEPLRIKVFPGSQSYNIEHQRDALEPFDSDLQIVQGGQNAAFAISLQ